MRSVPHPDVTRAFLHSDSNEALRIETELLDEVSHYQGGPAKQVSTMVSIVAQIRDGGNLPGAASLVLSQLLLNAAGRLGKENTMLLVAAFLDAADVPR